MMYRHKISAATKTMSVMAKGVFCQIQHNYTCSEDLCKLCKEYLNALTYKFYTFL